MAAGPGEPMKRSHFGARVAGGLLLAFAMLALAPGAAAAGLVDEVKLGLLAHDVGVLGDPIEHGADVVGEILFASPDFLSIIGTPRPTIGGSVNTAGKTNYAYADLTWTATLWRPDLQEGDGIYLGGFLGGAIHDGRLQPVNPGSKDLGTRGLFHLGVEAGYQITSTYSVEGYFSHLSNANISRHNPGLNNAGLRLGYKF